MRRVRADVGRHAASLPREATRGRDDGHACVGGHQVDDLAQAAPHLVRGSLESLGEVRASYEVWERAGQGWGWEG